MSGGLQRLLVILKHWIFGRQKEAKRKKLTFFFYVKNYFTRIMNFKFVKKIWDYLKKEYFGYERIRG